MSSLKLEMILGCSAAIAMDLFMMITILVFAPIDKDNRVMLIPVILQLLLGVALLIWSIRSKRL